MFIYLSQLFFIVQNNDEKSAKWIAADALRELVNKKTQERLQQTKSNYLVFDLKIGI